MVIGEAVAKAFGELTSKAVGPMAGRIWSWSLFLLVLALTSVAIIRSPGGPGGESIGILLVCGLAVLASSWRAIGVGRLEPRAPLGRRAAVSALSLTLSISGLVWSEELRNHGDVDVTGLTSISPATSLHNGATAAVGVDRVPARARLRMAFTVSDTVPAAQSCTPDTRLDVGLAGATPQRAHRDVRSGSTVEISLGGQRPRIRLRVILHTAPGCRMNVSIAEAVLHD
ncbi:hypothetical protein [Streptomyces sp. NPDC052701]|uniref:hypothetical protein n=1 Tax=Streptomyces sp. NPDC052701 TaxID=3155533 RepID=UPI00343177BD